MTVMAPPRWENRDWRTHDRAEVLALFTEPDFFYRTETPDTRPEWELLELLGADTRVLLADGELAGLYAVENFGSEHGCYYLVQLRLRAGLPIDWWRSAFHELARAARWRREVVRLAVQFGEFDEYGLRVARSLDLTEEGTLAQVSVHGGRRHGQVYFAQIWAPTS
jgi:hypothetical protein